ncbi:uncharacterized protein A4U43_C07F38390 [Asparagus officinalis]|uniref:H(+)/Pi cotransporter n=2 Tax=Asparagus officinalis TaxID=4686 RepID=A0A5P1EIG9_ASPOF|nr:uncharacterized protein A4U43_C07F38390 [Asparagus officinalis]
MADPSPLLKRQSPTTSPSIEDTIESCIGPSGLAQLLQAFIISFAWFFDAQQTFISIFADTYPSWRCTYSKYPSCSSATPCSLPPASWSWSQSKETSIVSEWNLECAPPALLGLPASAYFSGCLAGGLILATFADSWLGRKKMIVLSCLTMSVSASLAAVSPNIFVYAALRFVCGFGRATVATSTIVLSTEIVGRRWRDRVSNFGYFCFTLGFLSLPGMAYLGRGSSWRNLYIWTSVPSFCYTVLICFLIRESPRWLLIRGRRDEAVEALKRIAKSNRSTVVDFTVSDVPFVDEESELKNVGVYSALRILWQKKWASAETGGQL